MTLRRSSRHGRARWVGLAIAVAATSTILIGSALATLPSPPFAPIPSNFFKVLDQQGANDVPGQVDLTQMGRDDTVSGLYKLFWSWDSIDQWTGTGQTGDACALFDSDGDTKINFVVCARVSNLNADPTDVRLLPQDSTHPVYMFVCSDAKNDRCTQPNGPLPYGQSDADAGVIGDVTNKGNLITGTDPFDSAAVNGPGTSFPYDTTVQVNIKQSILPAGSTLTNVCSYPSAGNGGNNNPFDCIVSPGGGFLVITKDAGTTTQQFTFDTTNTPQSSYSITGSGSTSGIGVLVTKEPSITERAVANWTLQGISCTKEGGGSTGTVDLANHKVTGITIESGKTTTCTFTNRPVLPKLTVTKVVVNDNGGTKQVADFPLFVGTTQVTSSVQNSFAAGGYTVSETQDPGYTATISGDCAADGSITLALGDVKSCTITNDDKAPSLTLNKIVVNDNGGTTAESAWTLTANGGTAGTLSGPGAAGSTDVVSGATFKAGTYALSESGPSTYTASPWSCVKNSGTPVTGASITLGLGDTATCTITNDDKPARPSGTTIQSWVLHDSITITGIRPGGTGAYVTFELFSNDTCTVSVGSETNRPIDGNGVASTDKGISVSTTGFYYWIVTYSGDQNNERFSTSCGDEVTQIQAKDAYGGGRNDLNP